MKGGAAEKKSKRREATWWIKPRLSSRSQDAEERSCLNNKLAQCLNDFASISDRIGKRVCVCVCVCVCTTAVSILAVRSRYRCAEIKKAEILRSWFVAGFHSAVLGREINVILILLQELKFSKNLGVSSEF